MAYLMLINEVRTERRDRAKDESQRLMADMARYRDDLMSRGLCTLGESLKSDASGARIQARGGKRQVSDGPFTEAKEIVGGIFLLDVRTREEALAIAQECPAVGWATVEVRELGPCWE